jgi:hypothetical protein
MTAGAPDWLDERTHQLVRHVACAGHMVGRAYRVDLEVLLGELLPATRLALKLSVPGPDEPERAQLLAALENYLEVPDREINQCPGM